MKASDLLIKSLEAEGVEYIFGLPGEENLDLLESIRKSSLKLIVTKHEQAAGFMAAMYSRFTEKVGVCFTTLGPGLTNAITSFAYAKLIGAKVLFINGQKTIEKNTQADFQLIDSVALVNSLVKYSKQLLDPDSIPAQIRVCFEIANEPKYGPCHLELPENIASSKSSASLINSKLVLAKKLDDEALNEALTMISDAQNPILILGSDSIRDCNQEALLNFVKSFELPFFTTQMGKGAIDERHKLFLGTIVLSKNDLLESALEKTDLIITIGYDLVEKPVFVLEDKKIPILHINNYISSLNEFYFPKLELVADISSTLNSITNNLKVCKLCKELDFYQALKSNFYKEQDLKRTFPVKPLDLVKVLREKSSEDTILSLDNGMYKLWFARYFRAYAPKTFFLDNALATMGAGLPAAILLALLKTDQKVLAICGDGGFAMNMQELETAKRLGLKNLIVIIVSDCAFGMISWKQEIDGFQDYGLSFGETDYIKLAEAFGFEGYSPSSFEEFENNLEQIFNRDELALIEVKIDYQDNKEEF